MESDESLEFRTIEIVRTCSSRGVKRGERGMRFDATGVPIWSHVIPVVEAFIYEGNVDHYNILTTPILLTDGAWLTHYKMSHLGESVFVRILPAPGMATAAV